jgi:hypothetical protein
MRQSYCVSAIRRDVPTYRSLVKEVIRSINEILKLGENRMQWPAVACRAIPEEQAVKYHLECNGLVVCVTFYCICTKLYTDPEEL